MSNSQIHHNHFLEGIHYAQRYHVDITIYTSDRTLLWTYNYYSNDTDLHICYPREHAFIQCHHDCCGTFTLMDLGKDRLVQVVITDSFKWDIKLDKPRHYRKLMLTDEPITDRDSTCS